jgi:hypothetical protein
MAVSAIFLVAEPPVSAAATPQLTLTGSRTSFTDLTLRSRTQFDFAHASLSGGGRYVGVYAEAIDKPTSTRSQPGARIGLIQLRDYHGPGEPSYVVGLDSQPPYLVPGRYRFYLVTDGRATVRLPMAGGRSILLRPTHPAYSAVDVAQNALTNPVLASNRQPLTLLGGRSLAFSTITLGRFRAYAGQIEACLALPGAACGSATPTSVDGVYTGWFISPINETNFSWLVGYEPGALKSGRYDAVQGAVNATTIQFATAAAFTLSLT